MKAKPWEATIEVYSYVEIKCADYWAWLISIKGRPVIWVESDRLYRTQAGAWQGARTAMVRLGLVERKAKAGKVSNG